MQPISLIEGDVNTKKDQLVTLKVDSWVEKLA